jgi:primary-amine oxidase
VVEVDTVAVPMGPDNPYGNAFAIQETVLASEAKAQRNVDFNHARYWKIESAERRNALGAPTAYKLEAHSAIPMFTSPQSMVGKRAGFMARQLWVTAHDPEQLFAAGRYPNQSAGGDGLPAYVQGDRPLVDQDLVIWHSFGLHHIPRPEDFPVQSVVTAGFALKPEGFFSENPALDVPPAASKMSCCV